jgi:urocanate hydratase
VTEGARPVKARRGAERECRGWVQEAALRMLCNNLDPEVAERPDDLVVYGGAGKAARNWECFDHLVTCLRDLGDEETLLVQSGKPVGVFRTHRFAPRVLLANSLLVPRWATWQHFWELEALGLMMFGQMTAGSWMYIGTQGILQGTFETFLAAAAGFGGNLHGRLVLTSGLGGMGGAQPLAVTMLGGVALCVEVDPARIARRQAQGYVERATPDLEEALRWAETARRQREPLSIALCANSATVYATLAGRPAFQPDVVTDQTAAHDPLHGYIPEGLSLEEASDLRARDPLEYVEMARASMVRQVQAMLAWRRRGVAVFDYGNNLRGEASEKGLREAFEIPGFVPAYLRKHFCEGRGPFRWVALSGDPDDIARTDQAVLEELPDSASVQRWIPLARQHVRFQGLPARICWLGYGERDRVGRRFNQMVRRGEVKAPLVIGRDHLDAGSVASPHRETEAMRDGSDAVADWPILNALINTAAGAGWVAVHHGGGVGMGLSLHAGMVVVADGSDEAEERLARVLTCDPGTGVMRHADAGYPEARAFAHAHGIRIPMA